MKRDDALLLWGGLALALLALVLAFGMVGCGEWPTVPGPELRAAKPTGPSGGTAWDSVLIVPVDTTVAQGVALQLCSFPVFRNGTIGLRRVDAARCAAAYQATVPDSLSQVNRQQQKVLDTLPPFPLVATLDAIS